MKLDQTAGQTFTIPIPFDEAMERSSRVNTKGGGQGAQEKGAAPFVKWAGGKRGIIDNLIRLLPEKFNDYYEPFAGGAALFFAIEQHITKAYLSDSNLDLAITFQAVKNEPEALLSKLEGLANHDSEAHYYKIRAQQSLQDPLEIAARFIYLNKTCYNGLYRVNKKGEFNVPRGRYANPGIVQRENILASSQALQKANIEYREFDTIKPKTGDFVYFDPPYHPSDIKSFTKYTKMDFSEKDQERLRNYALEVHRKRVKVMLSNSDTPFIRSLYNATTWNTETVQAPRLVNCKSESRKAVNELVIRNYV